MSNPFLSITPTQQRVCPGIRISLEFTGTGFPIESPTWTVDTAPPTTLQGARFFLDVRQDGELVHGSIVVDVEDWKTVRVGNHVIALQATTPEHRMITEARATITIRDEIHLVPDSIEWNGSTLTGTIEIENCCLVKPEVKVQVRCDSGHLVPQTTLGVRVPGPGLSTFEFQLAESPPTQLGKCNVELVDKHGKVLDKTPYKFAYEPLHSTQVRQPPPSRSVLPEPIHNRILRKEVLWAGALSVLIIGLVALVMAVTGGGNASTTTAAQTTASTAGATTTTVDTPITTTTAGATTTTLEDTTTSTSTTNEFTVTDPIAATSTAAATYTVQGTAAVGYTVRIYEETVAHNDQLDPGEPAVGESVAADDGTWSLTVPLNPGQENYFIATQRPPGETTDGPYADVPTITQG